MTETVTLKQKDQLRKAATHQQITLASTKRDINMHRGECTLCNCSGYIGANVGICENCGHHYNSHRY